MKKRFSTTKRWVFIAGCTLLVFCFLGPSEGAQAQIVLLSPNEGSIYDTCDLYYPPSFQWSAADEYKSLEIRFSTGSSPKTVKVNIPVSTEQGFQPTPSVWKKVFLLAGSNGGTVLWRVIGTRSDGPPDESDALSFQIAAPRSVQDPVISPTDWSLPTLTWKSSCQSKFKVWFGSDPSFINSKGFSFKGSGLSQGDESFAQQLTSKQWSAVRKLVGNRSGERIYWVVEAWDGLRRRSVTEVMDFPLDISMDNLPPSVLLDVAPQKTVAGFCYLESFSMQIGYIDSSVTVSEAFTFAGLGAVVVYWPGGKAFVPALGFTYHRHMKSVENYGVHLIVGHDVTGDDGDYMDVGALARTTYSGPDEALWYLKALLRSNRPVQVHVDLYYLPSLPKYHATQPRASHFLLVNGYDENEGCIYVTETYLGEQDKDQYKDVKIPVNEFMDAWWNGGVPPDQNARGHWPGPYWMSFLLETEGSQLDKMSVAEALDMQREFSADNESTITRYATSDFVNTNWGTFPTIKRLFGDYLAANGKSEAAAANRQLADEYRSCEALSVEDQRAKLINVIAPLEGYARTLY